MVAGIFAVLIKLNIKPDLQLQRYTLPSLIDLGKALRHSQRHCVAQTLNFVSFTRTLHGIVIGFPAWTVQHDSITLPHITTPWFKVISLIGIFTLGKKINKVKVDRLPYWFEI